VKHEVEQLGFGDAEVGHEKCGNLRMMLFL
jgi:hypothetical protein